MIEDLMALHVRGHSIHLIREIKVQTMIYMIE
jgi:hypothetical protein